jgi:DNA-binding transcriptional ArsR family regulator
MDQDLDPVFKALADRHRRLILDKLRLKRGQTLGELSAHLEMTRQAVSKHLAVLAAGGLVVTVRRGREKLHYLNPVPIHQIYERWISQYERDRLAAIHEIKTTLEDRDE